MAAAAAAAAVTGATPPPQTQNNVENLLDIDFDGGAPASAQKEPDTGMSGLEGLAGTPVRVQSPATNAPAPSNNLDDLLGVFGDSSSSASPAVPSSGAAAPAAAGAGAGPSAGGASADLLDGLGGLDIGGNSTTSPPPTSSTPGGQKKTNEDILSLF